VKGYYVYYGEERYPLEIPPGWTVLQNTVSEEVEISLTTPEMVEKALAAPISSPRLSEIVHEDSKVAEMAQLAFIINCVYNSRAEVVDVVAGHFQKAHLAGVERSREN
jgi:nickel-dependent lactate racemase